MSEALAGPEPAARVRQTGMLGLVNASGEVHILERLPDQPGFKTVLKEGVPVATCVHLQARARATPGGGLV